MVKCTAIQYIITSVARSAAGGIPVLLAALDSKSVATGVAAHQVILFLLSVTVLENQARANEAMLASLQGLHRYANLLHMLSKDEGKDLFGMGKHPFATLWHVPLLVTIPDFLFCVVGCSLVLRVMV